jgi:hypothetical protein
MSGRIRGTLWRRFRADGEAELRTRSKLLLTIMPLLLAALLFPLLLTIERMDGGTAIIEVFAYGVILLVVAASLLTLIISLIEYLRSLE